MKKILFSFLLVMTLSVSAFSDALEDGIKAYKSGDYKLAVKLFTKACDGGNAIGCSNLGLMYYDGQGVKQDYFQAVKLFTKACDGGEARGCYNLGFMHEKGQGVKQDYLQAVKLYTKACDGGYQLGCEGYADLNKQGY